MEYKNKTTIAYSDDENELTVLVNEKPITKYTFVPYPPSFKDFENPCKPCVFFSVGCGEIRCGKSSREDCTEGYFIIK